MTSTSRKLKVYVAAGWDDRDSALALMEQLEMFDVDITFKWPLYETEAADPDEMQKRAVNDARGVAEADVLVAMPGAAGTWCEVGMAIGQGKPVIYFRPVELAHSYPRDAVFFHLPKGIKVMTFAALMDELRLIADRYSFFIQ